MLQCERLLRMAFNMRVVLSLLLLVRGGRIVQLHPGYVVAGASDERRGFIIAAAQARTCTIDDRRE